MKQQHLIAHRLLTGASMLLTAALLMAIARWFHPATFSSPIVAVVGLLGTIVFVIGYHQFDRHD